MRMYKITSIVHIPLYNTYHTSSLWKYQKPTCELRISKGHIIISACRQRLFKLETINFDLSKDKGIKHNNEKDRLKISETAKFGWVKFYIAEDMALKRLRILNFQIANRSAEML